LPAAVRAMRTAEEKTEGALGHPVPKLQPAPSMHPLQAQASVPPGDQQQTRVRFPPDPPSGGPEQAQWPERTAPEANDANQGWPRCGGESQQLRRATFSGDPLIEPRRTEAWVLPGCWPPGQGRSGRRTAWPRGNFFFPTDGAGEQLQGKQNQAGGETKPSGQAARCCRWAMIALGEIP